MASGMPTQAVINEYRQLVHQSQQLASKISELEMSRNEHRLVEETLRPLDPDRRAFRLVGSILVERNVAEVLPSVTLNRENVRESVEFLFPFLSLTLAAHPHLVLARCYNFSSDALKLDRSITTLRENLEESQKKAAEIKVKYNLQTEPAR